MKVTYTPNPLNTVVELDAGELKLLEHKLRIETYEDMMFLAHQSLVTANINAATQILDPDVWCNIDCQVDASVREEVEDFVEALKGAHAGDCTCMASSCLKCHAEELVGVNTLYPFPGTKAMYFINLAFRYKDGDEWKQRTLDEALEFLRAYEPKYSRVEVKAACEFLLEYKNTHFPQD